MYPADRKVNVSVAFTFSPLTGIGRIQYVTERFDLIFNKETRNRSGSAPSVSDSSVSARTLVVSVNIIASPQSQDQ